MNEMTREEQLKYCKICNHKKLDIKQGLICKLSGEKADFQNTCQYFEKSEEAKKLEFSSQAKVQKLRKPRKLNYFKTTINILYWFTFALLPISIIFQTLNWPGGAISMVLGLFGISIYYLLKSIRDFVKKNFTLLSISLHILIIFMSVIIFTKYLHWPFGDVPGVIIVPIFFVISVLYLSKAIYKSPLNWKLLILVSLYVISIIPMLISFKNGPRKLIINEWLPESINNEEKRNENWAWFIDENSGQGMWVPIGNKTTVKNGKYTLFFCNGEIRQKGEFQDGIDSDTIYYYDIKGTLIIKEFTNENGEVKKFISDGKYKFYYPTCQLESQGEIKNNELINSFISYYINGKMKNKLLQTNDSTWVFMNFYSNGIMADSGMAINEKYNGLIKKWYQNGQLKVSTYYINNVEHGTRFWYFKNGQIKERLNFVHGKYNGLMEIWYQNGQKNEETEYLNGIRNGKYLVWHSNGQQNQIGSYKNGELYGKLTMWHKNGQLELESTYINDSPDGELKMWFSNGKMHQHAYYKSKKLNGPYIEWFENGQIQIVSKYINNLMNGISIWYYENGQINTKCNFSKNIKNGFLVSYYKNGNLKSKGLFKNDKEEGIVLHYFENGNLKSKENYTKGIKNGKLWYYYENSQLSMYAISKNNVTTYYKSYNKEGKLIEKYDGNKIIYYEKDTTNNVQN